MVNYWLLGQSSDREAPRSQTPTFCRLKERHHSSTREHRTLDIKGSLFCLPPQPRTMLHFALGSQDHRAATTRGVETTMSEGLPREEGRGGEGLPEEELAETPTVSVCASWRRGRTVSSTRARSAA